MVNRALMMLFLLCSFCRIGYATELMSEEAINYYNQAVKAQKMRSYYQAQTGYHKAIIVDQDTKYKKFIFNNLGVIHAESGDVAKAEVAFREALKLDPDYKTAGSNLALLYLKVAIAYKDKGQTKKALENFEKAFSYYPEGAFMIEEEKEAQAGSSGN